MVRTLDIVFSQDFFPKIGGAHLWLYETYKRWPSHVNLLTRHYDDSLEERRKEASFDGREHGAIKIIRKDIAIHEINLFELRCSKRFMHASSTIKRLAGYGQSTIHCLRAFPEGFSALLVKLRKPYKTRLIVYAHGEETIVANSSRQLKLISYLVYRSADLVIANSENTASLVKEICRQAKIVCVHPGVEYSLFQKDATEIDYYRRQWRWPKENIVVFTVARMEPRKNQETVIRAISNLRKEGLPLAYICAGDGEERKRLEKLSEEMGLGPYIMFPGVLAEEKKILTYLASNIYAMPSISTGNMIEGFGIVFLEAAAAGIPSICGNNGGQSEAVLNGKTGYVVDGLDLKSVENAIRKLANDPILRKKMGEEGKLWAKAHDWNTVSSNIFNIIKKHVY